MNKELKLSKGKKIVIITSVTLVVITILSLLLAWTLPVKGRVSDEHWYSRMEYTDDYAYTMEKKPGKDFEILVIADMQLNDTDMPISEGDPFKEIDTLLATKNPDLIIVLGDITWQAFTKLSVKKFVKYMDSKGIPWAPIFGNHEDEKEQGYYCAVDKNWVADELMKSKTCLFKKGPNNIGGVGNYVINIKENNKIVETMVFMDTHAGRTYPELDNKHGYDYIYDSQMDWYRWVINGVTKTNGGVMPESMLYIHIPLVEYGEAYKAWEEWHSDQVANGKHDVDPFGKEGNRNENECPGVVNSGMFDLIKELGSTKYVFAGHDHSNNYSLLYEGVRLTYTTKTGYRCDYADGQTGGTWVAIGDKVDIEHQHIEYDK